MEEGGGSRDQGGVGEKNKARLREARRSGRVQFLKSRGKPPA